MSEGPEHSQKGDEPLAVRPLGGANCSSVGSVVDMLFAAGALGGMLLVAATAALDELELARAEGEASGGEASGGEARGDEGAG